jgi:hypothetical protein
VPFLNLRTLLKCLILLVATKTFSTINLIIGVVGEKQASFLSGRDDTSEIRNFRGASFNWQRE